MEGLFSPVTPEDFNEIYEYTSRFGEGCCQHSPVAMWSLWEKYGDEVCIADDVLYVHRSKLSNEDYRVYLCPFGEDVKKGFEAILSDAHEKGKKAKFYTLTKEKMHILRTCFPNRFHFENNRDMAEYIFDQDTFLHFPGKRHARRRTEIRSYWRDFGEDTLCTKMEETDLPEVLAYAKEWLTQNELTHDKQALEKELFCIEKQVKHFRKLGITGTVLRYRGSVRGFSYGIPLNREYYDVLIEKADRNLPGIYRVLRQESTKINAANMSYINFEEDVGEPGLRKLKESYGPAFLIEKFIATEC